MNLEILYKGTAHHLKTWPIYFEEVCQGRKKFEVRKEDDKVFSQGDLLVLQEWDPATQEYTGRISSHWVTYLLRGPSFGIEAGTVVMSLSGSNPGDSKQLEVR